MWLVGLKKKHTLHMFLLAVYIVHLCLYLPTDAPNLPGTQHNVTCNVSYTSVVELSCPAGAGVNAFWKRQTVNGSEPLCRAQGRNCYLSDLRNEDTGLYFCFDPVINGSYAYYVHLTVLGRLPQPPPSILYVLRQGSAHSGQ